MKYAVMTIIALYYRGALPHSIRYHITAYPGTNYFGRRPRAGPSGGVSFRFVSRPLSIRFGFPHWLWGSAGSGPLRGGPRPRPKGGGECQIHPITPPKVVTAMDLPCHGWCLLRCKINDDNKHYLLSIYMSLA